MSLKDQPLSLAVYCYYSRVFFFAAIILTYCTTTTTTITIIIMNTISYIVTQCSGVCKQSPPQCLVYSSLQICSPLARLVSFFFGTLLPHSDHSDQSDIPNQIWSTWWAWPLSYSLSAKNQTLNKNWSVWPEYWEYVWDWTKALPYKLHLQYFPKFTFSPSLLACPTSAVPVRITDRLSGGNTLERNQNICFVAAHT